MKGYRQAAWAYDNAEPEEVDECPECGSTNIETDHKYKFECLECGYISEVDYEDFIN